MAFSNSAEDLSFGFDHPFEPPPQVPRWGISLQPVRMNCVAVPMTSSECCPPCFYGMSYPRAEVPEKEGVSERPTTDDEMSTTDEGETLTNALSSSDEEQAAGPEQLEKKEGRISWADQCDTDDEDNQALSHVEPPQVASPPLQTFEGESAHAKSGALYGTGSSQHNLITLTQWAGKEQLKRWNKQFAVLSEQHMSPKTTIGNLKGDLKNRFPQPFERGLVARFAFVQHSGQEARPFMRCHPQQPLADDLTLGELQEEFDANNPRDVIVILKVELVHAHEVAIEGASEHLLRTGYGCFVTKPWKGTTGTCGFKGGSCDLCHHDACQDPTPKETQKSLGKSKKKKNRPSVEKMQQSLMALC